MNDCNSNDPRNIMLMKRPASMYCHRWRDATPIGTGKTGVLFYGGTSGEQLVFNRSNLWYHGGDAPVPDVSSCVGKMRELQKQGKYMEAHDIMYNELVAKNYGTVLSDMRALGVVKLAFFQKKIYKNYRREISMDTSEARVSYKLDECKVLRKYLASRKRDLIAMDITSEEAFTLSLSSGFYETREAAREADLRRNDAENAKYSVKEGCFLYSSANLGKYFGIAVKVVSDGKVYVSESGIKVEDAKHILLLIKSFSEEEVREDAEEIAVKCLLDCPGSYEEIFVENLPLYESLYKKADIRISDCDKLVSNEKLISDAKEEKLTAELAEKLWRFSRYLFISGTDENALPFPLYGIWTSGYGRNFTHHVANENVQSIYWHTDAGGLSSLNKALINYYCNNMDSFRENALKLFGCKGIFVGTYTTPKNFKVAWYVPVILHFNGVAGWLSQHFYRYYQYTGDEALFKEKILPFMIEAAEFYEDFHYVDENGKLALYPAVSPENSPIEFYDKTKGHPMPVTKNPTVEIAILKELLKNLLKEAEKREELKEKTAIWENMLSIIPEYLINDQGAVAEWIADDLHDTYDHRHISHLYPIFPGTEFEDEPDERLFKAFKKAVDLREFGSFCGWSLPHMSAIYSRFCDSEKAFYTLNGLSKVCLLDNFFTLGHDYRDMGVTGFDCGDEFSAEMQLDALMGFNNALQEMMLFASEKKIKIIPACPKEFGKGSAHLYIPTGEIEFNWDIDKKECHGKITASRKTKTTLVLPFAESKVISLEKGEYFEF